MPLPRFSEALVTRRHQLGLSIAQASRVLKLREDVLVAFEEGDFDHMPQSGYAQGMLSSYARYLGLNAREIVDVFQEEFYEHRHGASSHELRRRTRHNQTGRGVSGYDMPNEADSRPKAYVEYRPLLPTSGGPAGDLGDFATTADARPRSSVPLAGINPAPGTRGSLGSSYPAFDDRGTYQRRYNPTNNTSADRPAASGSTARRRGPAARRRDGVGGGSPDQGRPPAGRDGSRYLRDDVSTRRVRRGEYVDDMRLDDAPRPSVPASTASGRRSSRNIASTERPNVRRRPARGRQAPPPRRTAPGGALGRFVSDPRRALLLLILALCVVLTAILLFSVSSCVNGRNQGGGSAQVVPVEDVGSDAEQTDGNAADEGDEPDDGTSAEPGGDDAEPAVTGEDGTDVDEPTSEEEPEEVEPTVVEVSVASGAVSWLEITCDGTSEVADSVTGPWRQSYTVTESITIQATSPDVVTVSENGKRVDLSPRAGGLGSVTIEGTPLPEAAPDAADGEGSTEGATNQ